MLNLLYHQIDLYFAESSKINWTRATWENNCIWKHSENGFRNAHRAYSKTADFYTEITGWTALHECTDVLTKK